MPFSLPTSKVLLALSGGLPFALVALAPSAGPDVSGPVRYGRDVRPILADRCFKCHGPDEASRRAELRLDLRDEALAERDGAAAIVPGDLAASELWRRVASADPDVCMPPPDANKRALSEEEREVVRRWIEEGAEYEPHWAFVPPARPAPPAVRASGWPRNALDRFVLARLEAERLAPNEEADRATLLRRVFLDLTGLPPTPEELDAFLRDERADAYERQVERLLTEEPWVSRYAERMATPWLDAARYADTSGIHMDAGRQIWPYRDWVLAAFRAGMPYDRFVTEQLAGDLLPDATRDQRVASGFNRNHVTTDEGGAIDAEYLVEYAVDRTATTGSVFLGLTLGCARCHEHKFDPVSQEEFYGLYAFFDSVEGPGLYSQLPDANRALEPFMAVPTPEQEQRQAELARELESARSGIAEPDPEDAARYAAFLADVPREAGVEWAAAETVRASSSSGATLAVQPDGSVLASGANPERDDHTLVLRTEARGLRLLLLEALPDPSLFEGRVGRAKNGNAVLTSIEAVARSLADPARSAPIRFVWAWADHEQPNNDFDVTNALDPSDAFGWAVGGHQVTGGRTALFLAEEPFGYEGGTEIEVTLRYRSVYPEHVFGRVRLTPGRLGDAGLARLPVADTRWYAVEPFQPDSRFSGYDQTFGPERVGIDHERSFPEKEGADKQLRWSFVGALVDGAVYNDFAKGQVVTYAGKRLFAPAEQKLAVALGSDDGVQVFLDGARVFENRIDRGVAADQDRFELVVPAGVHDLVVKIVNTGGDGGLYWRAAEVPEASALAGPLVLALVPQAARAHGVDGLAQAVRDAWRLAHSPSYRAGMQQIAALEQAAMELRGAIPLTMVMKELDEPRPTYLLVRGQYDHPDKGRPIERGVPAALGQLPQDAPRDRLGLAQWLVAPANPLSARVFVNRLWELVFGTGLVATTEDFGLQGEWPSHPELLDWLAVELVESGYDVKGMLRLLVTSATYRQSARRRPEIAELDPDGRLLAAYPRRRLGAEELRDQALYVSGLLVERFGGPSVKPYQPEGLWQEVAMLQSNTRVYRRGEGDELWRRSLYTYWKRACPPPSLMTFDAPTREFCNVRRATTNTPLQALVLWNDEQFVEAARVLAQRTLAEMPPPPGDPSAGAAAGANDADGWRLARLFRRCTAREPQSVELLRLRAALDAWLERYAAAPEDAAQLLEPGEAPLPGAYDAPELAAWTMVASAVLSLDEVITRN